MKVVFIFKSATFWGLTPTTDGRVSGSDPDKRLGEIGLALGAEPHDIARLVIGERLKVAAVGSRAGWCSAIQRSASCRARFLALPQIDLPTLIALPAGVVVVLACGLPARRATPVDPRRSSGGTALSGSDPDRGYG